MMHYWDWGGAGFSGAGPVLLFVLFVGLAVLWASIGEPVSGGSRRPDSESAREILDRRYAAGELTKEQYDHMRQDLRAQT